jgi:hypothetical protein
MRPDGIPQPAGPAKGVLRSGRRQLVVRLDDDQFEEVRSRAERCGTSVAEQVRLLIEWGLEADV